MKSQQSSQKSYDILSNDKFTNDKFSSIDKQSFDKSSIDKQSIDNYSQQKIPISNSTIKSQNTIKQGSIQQMYMNQQQNLTQQDINQLKKIFAQFRDFKIDKQNKIQLNNPTRRIIFQTLNLWKKRPVKHPNYTLILSLQSPKIQKQKIIQQMQPFASLKLVIDSEPIQNKRAVHKLQNGTYYEGIDGQFMMITKINGDVIDYYEGQTKDFLQNGHGMLCHTIQGKSIWNYYGQFVDGKRQGRGKQIASKGVSYDGQFKNDFKHGKGIQVVLKKKKHLQQGQQPYVQKNRYVGQFQYGYKQGLGIEITTHGQYNGQWKQNMKHGKGTIKYKKGDTYEGDWSNNCQHGQGTYTEVVIINGQEKNNKYTGQFKQGYYHGKGVMEYWNGDKYDGQWVLGKKDGQGMYEWSDGDYYDGHWEKDSAEGTGAACFGGVFYDGEFHLGQKHGLGQETDADGNTVKAMWQSGKIKKKLQINGQLVDLQDQQN